MEVRRTTEYNMNGSESKSWGVSGVAFYFVSTLWMEGRLCGEIEGKAKTKRDTRTVSFSEGSVLVWGGLYLRAHWYS